ncbi:hypothetical protein [Belliella pelovolcani]|uniref:hypothetical protein n=1 Tax=Belliella pelovolcani TaxID=529505 RepID=UPI003919D18A
MKEIEELGGCFFTEQEILTITELTELSPAERRAMTRGALKSEAELRKYILDLARSGSSPAQTMAVKLLEKFRRENY